MAPHLPTTAITGATGNIGGTVARLLADAGTPVRLLVRDLSRAPDLVGAVALRASFSDREASVAALDGVETLLMVSAAENADRLAEHIAFLDAAREAGVGHIVYTSFFGAAPDCTFTLGRDHYATEECIKAAGFDYTFLRDNLYSDFVRSMAGEDGVIRGPAGQGRAALVARVDVARVASVVLANPADHRNAGYDMLGPESISMTDVAAALTEAGTPTTFHDETIAEAYESRKKWDAPDWQYDAWVSTYTAIANGELEGSGDDIERITGRRPLSLAEVLAG